MTGVFLSSQAIDRLPARALADALRSCGLPVETSPRNPSDAKDSRWVDWYATGLANAMRGVNVVVLVVDDVWDSSTWMAEEARLAFALLRADAVLFWNPNNIPVRAAAMLPYLKTRLPDAIPDAVADIQGFVEK